MRFLELQWMKHIEWDDMIFLKANMHNKLVFLRVHRSAHLVTINSLFSGKHKVSFLLEQTQSVLGKNKRTNEGKKGRQKIHCPNPHNDRDCYNLMHVFLSTVLTLSSFTAIKDLGNVSEWCG